MPFNPDYTTQEPIRAEIDTLAGATLLEFGSAWCGHCRRATPLVQQAFAGHPNIRHIKIEDGSGRPLGRSFRVRLWPTLVFLRDGREVSRLVRPQDAGDIAAAMNAIDPAGAQSRLDVSWSVATVLGLLAAALTTTANVPQVWKAWRTGETKDLSLAMTLILASGLALWVVYGVLQADAVIVIANAIAMVLAFALTALKLRHG